MNKITTLVACLTATALLQSQTIIRVSPTGTGDGTSWQNAGNLEEAIRSLSGAETSGTQIWVQGGTYQPSGMLTVPDSVKIYGGFSGTETMLSQRLVAANPVVIDGQQKIGSIFRLGKAAELHGLTIQNGNANGNPYKNGGGVWAEENAIIENCIITNNTALLNGGGIYANGSIKLINSTVENNSANGNGKNTFGHCLTITTHRTSATQSPLATTGCNTATPGWGNDLGTISFKSASTWTVGAQTWSDDVMATNCDKTIFNGGSTGNYHADCRNNESYGHIFSRCAMIRFADLLCPAPWRVPTLGDFVKLDKALGGSGNNRNGDYTTLAKYMGSLWGSSYGEGCIQDGSIAYPRDHVHYWSQTEGNDCFILRMNTSGDIGPQFGDNQYGQGFLIRCVRYD